MKSNIILISFSLLIFTSCLHKKSAYKKTHIKSNDGLIQTEIISMNDPHEMKIDKLLKAAYINYKNNNFNRAIIIYETAKIFTPELGFWHNYALAYCYLTTGDHAKSINLLEQLIEEKAEFADSYVLLGFNYLRLGKVDTAIHQFNRAIGLATPSPKTYYYLALAKKMKNSKEDINSYYEKAKNEYEDILNKNSDDFETLIEYAYFLTITGETAKAKEVYEKARNILNISPEIEEITYQKHLAPYQGPIWSLFYLNLIEGIILSQEKKHSEANELFLIALQDPPGGSKIEIAEIFYYLSQNFSALKNESAAKKALKLAKSLNPLLDYREK